MGAASRSYYRRLLQAGVRIHEFHPGLLHAKTLCVDGEITDAKTVCAVLKAKLLGL